MTDDDDVWADCPVCHNDDDKKFICPNIGCMNGKVLKNRQSRLV